MQENKAFQLEIKEISAQGTFEGMLSPYGNVDLGGDIVEPGAFTKTLHDKGNTRPLLWQHDKTNPIGMITLEDRASGLWAKGQLLMDLPQAQAAYHCLKAQIVRGLSIGFQTVKREMKDGVRRLKELKLYEGSIVTFPMNEEALIETVKAKGARTKRVDGVDLPASAFAYVGDPERTATWKLPIEFPSEDQTKSHIRNALARFSQTLGIPASERAGVLKKIQAAAKKYGIGQKEQDLLLVTKASKDFNDELAQVQALAGFYQMFDALRCAICEVRDDSEMTRDEKMTEVDAVLQQFTQTFSNYFPDYLDARDAMQSDAMTYYSAQIDEAKAGAQFSASSTQQIQAACDEINAGRKKILALLGGKAADRTLSTKDADAALPTDEAATSSTSDESKAATPSEPQDDTHSADGALESWIKDMRSLISA